MLGKTVLKTVAHRKELLIVALFITLIHAIFWVYGLPLAHVDLSSYTEPAFLLATQGKLAAPASQYRDITYLIGGYFQPPGYALILAFWIKLWGMSIDSLLAYTHLIHSSYLLLLWVLLRWRFHCTKLATNLVIISAFPYFSHGRPDITALCLGLLAWLILPSQINYPRLTMSSICLGLSVLVSPPFGLSSALAVGIFYVFNPGLRGWQKIKGSLSLIAISVAVFLGTLASVLTWQKAWQFGIEQFQVHVETRGSDLNTFPQPPLLYGLVFIVIPLLLTLLPALIVLGVNRVSLHQPLVLVSLAYLGSFSLWFNLSKSALLMSGYHFLLLARFPLHGLLASFKQNKKYLFISLIILFTIINFYYYKDDWLAFTSNPRNTYTQVKQIPLKSDVLIVDSVFFPILYKSDKTLDYFVTIQDNSWQRYLTFNSKKVLDLLPNGDKTTPIEADVIVVSALTLSRTTPPDPQIYQLSSPANLNVKRLTIFGKTVEYPQNPLQPYIFYRINERSHYPNRPHLTTHR